MRIPEKGRGRDSVLRRVSVSCGHDKSFKWGENQMIDYEEELKKFEPCLDVTDAEGAIYARELSDLLDILRDMLKESKETPRRMR